MNTKLTLKHSSTQAFKHSSILTIIALASLCLSSCVTLGKYEAIESRNAQLRREYNTAQSELADLRDENANLQRQNQSLNTQITDLSDLHGQLQDSITTLHRDIDNIKLGFDTLIENYNQRITGQSQDLSRTNNLLAARTKELNDKEAAFHAKEAAFHAKEAELQRKENETRRALEAKERELENLRTKLNNALVGFADKGLNVETRDGKVYVSMDSKLLFPSASWTVSKDGVEAIKTLATVLEQNTDLNIMVEGHTDNAAFKGSTAVKDNWDLSVMRATSIVKLILKHGPSIDPARIEASGHAEFAPKVPNDTPANKALNRRTEIILTPKMSDILNLIDK